MESSWLFSSTDIPCPTHQQILLVLPSKYIQNAITFYNQLSLGHHHVLLGFLWGLLSALPACKASLQYFLKQGSQSHPFKTWLWSSHSSAQNSSKLYLCNFWWLIILLKDSHLQLPNSKKIFSAYFLISNGIMNPIDFFISASPISL